MKQYEYDATGITQDEYDARIEIAKRYQIAIKGQTAVSEKEELATLDDLYSKMGAKDERYWLLRKNIIAKYNHQTWQGVFQVADATMQVVSDFSDMQTENELNNLKKTAKSQKEYDTKRAAIEKEDSHRKYMIAIFERGLALAKATEMLIYSAVHGSSEGGIWGAIAEEVLAVGELAIVLSSQQSVPEPKFELGRIGNRSRRRNGDSFSAMLGDGETVIPATQSAMHDDTLRAIMNNTANTAAGVRGGGKGDTFVFQGVSTEQMLAVQVSSKRRNSVGRRI